MSLAFLCPGQGSQKIGMGQDIFENSDLAKSHFETANDILGVDIQDIMFNGPDETLKQTQYTQPALYIVAVTIGLLLIEKGIKPDCAAGHSLGEYSAYALSGAFDFETGLQLVNVRAKSMKNAGTEHPGTMAAIIGLDNEMVENIAKNVSGTVVAANYNAPGQVVISGTIDAVNSAMTTAKENGAPTLELTYNWDTFKCERSLPFSTDDKCTGKSCRNDRFNQNSRYHYACL